jgi:GTP 3',8-cyclase
MLTDSFGRVATDLRVSLTDRCNLRCSYCMPAEGLDWLPRAALLTDDEVTRLISVAVRRLGITEVRFTGGEPLLRRGLPGLVARVAALARGRRSRSPPTASGSAGWPGHCGPRVWTG